jgi:hypothetical protein
VNREGGLQQVRLHPGICCESGKMLLACSLECGSVRLCRHLCQHALFPTCLQLEVALEELERAQQQLRELSVERDHLLQRLAAASGSHSGSSRRLPGAASGGVEADGGDATGDGWEGHPGGEAGSGEGLRAGRTFSGGSGGWMMGHLPLGPTLLVAYQAAVPGQH